MSFLERLRQKPAPEKARYAFLIALVLTLVIGGVWTTTIPARFTAISSSMDSVESQTGAVQNGFEDFMGGIDEIVAEAEIDQLGGGTNEENTFEPQGALGDLSLQKESNVATTTPILLSPTTTSEATLPPKADTGTGMVSGGTATQPRIIQIGTTTKKAE